MSVHSVNSEGLQRLQSLINGSHWLNKKEGNENRVLDFFFQKTNIVSSFLGDNNNLEEEKKADIDEKKPIDLKPILTIKVDEPPISVFNCDPTPEPKSDVAGSVGMLIMSKRKTKNWLNVPVKPKHCLLSNPNISYT